jgi:hypothetical protein
MDIKPLSATIGKSDDQSQILMDLQRKEDRRYLKYNEYWRMYRGVHWNTNELDEDGPSPVINKCVVFVNKGISFLVGNPPTVNYALPEVEKLLAPYVNRIIKNSGGMARLSFETTQMGGVTGDVFLKPVYDPEIGGVRIQVCDSSDVAVRYPFRDYQNVSPSRAEISWKFIDESDENKVKTYKEVWTKRQKIVYIDGVQQIEESGVNLLDEVPITHIRNLIIGKEVYGMSDIEQLNDLNKLLNGAIRKFTDDVDYSGDPITLLFGVRISQLEKGQGKMWGNLPLKARVENLLLETDFPARQKMIEYIDTALHEVGGIVKESVIGQKAISNTSGVALHMNNLPIIELVDRKKVTYGPGFESALKMALYLMLVVDYRHKVLGEMAVEDRMLGGYPVEVPSLTGILEAAQKITAAYSKSDNPYYKTLEWNDVEIQFQDYLPKDQLIEMQLIRDELTLGLESRKGAMKRLGKDNIEAVLAEVDIDIEKGIAQKLKTLYGQGKNVTQGFLDSSETSAGAAKGTVGT